MSKTHVLALSLVAGLTTGTLKADNQKVDVKKIGEETCSRYLNLLSTDPNNPNSQVFYAKGLVYPIIADCSRTIQSSASARAKITFSRSESLKDPTTGKVITSTVSESEKQIQAFASVFNSPVKMGENIKPYYASTSKPVISITNGDIRGHASPEGHPENGDISLFEGKQSENLAVAKKRAGEVKTDLISALGKTGATVSGIENITLSTKVIPLTYTEIGELYVEALKDTSTPPELSSKNIVMNRIVRYNTKGLASPAIERNIGQKRYAEAHIQFTASGIHREISTSKWNYAYWLGLIGLTGIAARRLRKK